MRINPNSSYVHVTGAIFDAVVATFLFVVCCLPIFTVGASAAALHATMLSIAEGSCSGVLRRFFGAFRENFSVATRVWLLDVLVGAVVAADIYVCWGLAQEPGIVLSVMRGLTIGCGVLYGCVSTYAFAGIAKYVVTWKQAIRNALIWTVKKPMCTAALLAINVLVVLACYMAWIWAFPVVVLLFYLRTLVLRRAFGLVCPPEERTAGGEEQIYYE